MADNGRLVGKRAIITGGARGIGACIAQRFVAEGASVVLIDLNEDVAVTAEQLGAAAVIGDLGDPAQATAATEQAIDTLDGVDILVNNAGILRFGNILDLSTDEWDEMLAINLRSMLLTTQTAVPVMIEQGTGGSIINLASMAAKQPAANHAHYSASKAGVVAFTAACAVEFGEHQITANSLCPGYVLTDMGAATRTEEMVKEWSAMSPLGRCAEPSDVAGLAVFCASEDGCYCTGQSFNVTGGMVTH